MQQINVQMTNQELAFICMCMSTQISIEDDQVLDPIFDLERLSVERELTAQDWSNTRKELSDLITRLIDMNCQLAKLEYLNRTVV